MKKITTILLLLLFTNFIHAQTDKDVILGRWETRQKDAQLIIYREGIYYYGKISWLQVPGKDVKNPKPELRVQDIVGSVILKDFIFNGKDKWENGKIYDPSGGKTYSCSLKLKNNNTLEVRGYIGISLLGRTEIWTRL